MAGHKAWGLFHYHSASGQCVRFSSGEEMSEPEAKSRAHEVNVGEARGSYQHDGWTVKALPVSDAAMTTAASID
jgi:hypothetical protein